MPQGFNYIENNLTKGHTITKKSNQMYFLSLLSIYFGLAIITYFALQPIYLHTQAIYVITLITNLPLSYLTLQTLLSLYYGKRIVRYERKKLNTYPRTAVILPVYNDIIPKYLLQTMKNNPGFDYWVLSDSNAEQKKYEEEISKNHSINYLHRGDRRGKKAGAINDWAKTHLWRYKYYVTLDKDSMMKENSIKELLEIAEHPSNSHFAVFQTMIYSLPGKSVFSHIRSKVSNIYIPQYPRNDALALGVANYWGHNALLRSEAFSDVGGQDESHLNEDISYTMKLRENGWNIAFVTDITSYEEQPGDLASEWERLARWMRGSYQSSYLALNKMGKIGIGAAWIIFLAGLIYFSGIMLLSLIILTALTPALWGSAQTGSGISMLAGRILFIQTLGTLFIGPVLPNIRKRDAWIGVFLIILNCIITMPGILRSTFESIKFLIVRSAHWSPTRLESFSFTMKDSIKFALPECIFGILLFIFLYVFADSSTVFQLSPWILSFILSPYMLYITSMSLHLVGSRRERG